MAPEIVKTDSKNNDFISLIKLLGQDLGERYGELQKQYDKYNQVDHINNVVLIYLDGFVVASGAFKEYDKHSVEMKRIFVRKEYRNRGLARLIMKTLEESARSSEYEFAVLETGIKQPEAINLYKSIGYCEIQNYGPYIGNPNSVCMKKAL